METLSVLLAICAGNPVVPGEFPAQRLVTRSFDVSLICTRSNGWVNNGEAGDLRRHRAHYVVTVMKETRLYGMIKGLPLTCCHNLDCSHTHTHIYIYVYIYIYDTEKMYSFSTNVW